MNEKMTAKHWIALIGLNFCSFIFNTSEFIPVGLLTDIGNDFHLTEAGAGMLISVYAWMVMLMSLPLMVWTSKMEMKKLMIILVALFTLCQVCSYFSQNFAMLMASRIGVACCHAIFWAIVSPLAVKIVPQKYQAVALSTIVTGSSIAMILGMPIGRMIGLWLGWRMTFLSIGIFSFATLIYICFTLPRVQSEGKFSLRQVPILLKNKGLVTVYILAFAIPLAYYTCYGYIEPFLLKVAGMSENIVTTTLMVYGAAGFLGSVIFAKFSKKNTTAFDHLTMIFMAISMALLHICSGSILLTIAACIVWGASCTAFNVAMQNEIIVRSPRIGTAVSMAIFSGIYNLGIGTGTYLGGAVCTHLDISFIGYTGSIVAILAVIELKSGVLSLPKTT